MSEAVADIAVIGLAVMGQNLILNMNDHGFTVCAFNRTVSKVDDFLNNEAKGTKIVGAHSLEEMVRLLKRPRRIVLLVKAGSAVQSMIDNIVPLLEKGDIIIDGGNSEYHDSNRRAKELAAKGLHFVGCGVSGGEEGARYGPSLMPGGASEAWPHLKEIFQSTAAKCENEPCCDWVGEAGSGHFVKMVHNGIEYGDMQLIAESYDVLHRALGLSYDEMADVFDQWNKTELDSFLIEITANILRYKDESGEPVVPKIRDTAGQKGTGKWTAIAALDFGMPVTLIAEAVFARCVSSLKSEREKASKIIPAATKEASDLIKDKKQFLEQVRQALYASKIVSYAQGFMLLTAASQEYEWKLNLGAISLMWRGGCIIRSRFLGRIKEAFEKNPQLTNLLLDNFFLDAINRTIDGWRTVVATAVQLGIPTPAFSAALAFYDSYRSAVLPANLIQAQRDYFGAHTYELLSKPGDFVHTNWTGKGGRVTSNAYDYKSSSNL
ncbi:6-phosphogluconate dehydrogenase, decarboxylating [Aphelenchoides besseyi]|nr:6-phosphogluconate dehydrogenase, decarboxylating [Aphelenchoides besseyi]KAI6228163.1 6-phosphogluconate dehydrogenase, decarboxylating [Aphelenchoides besseyi]